MAERTPLSSFLDGHALADPDAPCVTCGDETVTRAELVAWANRLARVYLERGVCFGDMITIALPNGTEFFAACLAAWKAGAVPQPVSPVLPLPERRAIVDLAGSRLVVGVEEGTHGAVATLPLGYRPPTDLSGEPLAPVVSPAWRAMTSGGSTGRPKLIVATQPGVVDTRGGDLFGIEDGDTQLIPGPLYHSGPFLFAMYGLFRANHLVVQPRFDAADLLASIDRHGVQITMVVPTMMSRMLRVVQEQPGVHQLRSLRRLWHLAAPCPDWLKRAWIDILGPERVFELYSGTEAQAGTVIDGVDWLAHPGSVGRPVVGEMTVLGDDGEEAPRGTIGEVYLRPGGKGRPTYRYIGAEAKRRGDWESLGDLGWMDQDGFLYLADRRTDLILVGGANVYPAEVEGAILEHPSVASCAVVGLPDEDLGQRVHAVVEVIGPVTEEDLRAFLAERLVRYKVPRSWELVDEPVRDDAGKVRRTTLVERATDQPAQ